MHQTTIEKRNLFIQDLEKVFSLALASDNYKATIKAKHEKAKNWNVGKNQNLSLVELSQQDLEMLINEAEDIKKWQTITKK